MRTVRYNVAASLDGYVAGPAGDFDWIPDDPNVDFAEIFGNVDTVLLGRTSYDVARSMGAYAWEPGTRVFVFSRTLRAADHPEVTLVADDAVECVRALRHEEGTGDIWLFGGGRLFRSLLDGGQVDRLEITVVPVLLGGGTPLLALGGPRTRLSLLGTRPYPSGLVTLTYDVVR